MATQNIDQLRCQAGKYNGFIIAPDATLHKCAKILYGHVTNACSEFNEFGYIDSNGRIILDESKLSHFLVMPPSFNKCQTCTWFPICVLTSCPYRNARGDYIKCKMQNKEDEISIQNSIVQSFLMGHFTNLKSIEV